MFRINLKRSIATVAVIAGVLAAAGAASAGVVHAPAGHAKFGDTPGLAGGDVVAGFKSLSGMDSETEFMDYTDDALLD
jgi:hypothetical protein